MKKRLKLKPFVLPVAYSLLVGVLLITLVLSSKTLTVNKEDDTIYVTGSILDSYVPVINLKEVQIMRPYSSDKVTIGKNFYNKEDTEDVQTNSIIYYESTYMQNSGIDYIAEEIFEVNAILNGEVIEVKKEELLGNVVTIRHDNELISIYQSLSEVSVAKGDQVTQGQVIGKSGTSVLNQELNDHLHFELMLKGQIVDPENYFDKTLSEIE